MAGGTTPWPRITQLQAKTVGAYQNIAPMGPTMPDNAETQTTAGGSATVSSSEVVLSTDGTVDETAAAVVPAIPDSLASGLIIGYFGFWVNQAQGNLAENMSIGFVSSVGADVNDTAVFRPAVGQDTEGNVLVDAGGIDTQGTLSYPNINQKRRYFAIVINHDTNKTEFYAEKNPLSDKPDVTVDAVPGRSRSPGAIIESATTDASEELNLTHAGVVMVP